MKICLAGTGAMGDVHVKALAKIEGVEVVSIAARTDESAKAFAEKYKIPFGSSNLEACIDRPGVDAVILTTPSDQHHDQTIMALSKGKHVQVEIPMALNLPDSQRMLEVQDADRGTRPVASAVVRHGGETPVGGAADLVRAEADGGAREAETRPRVHEVDGARGLADD